MILFRELSDEEVRRLLKPKKKKWVEPVYYRGLEPRQTEPVVRYTLEKTLRKIVNEEDSFLLIRQGWVIVEVDDPYDD